MPGIYLEPLGLLYGPAARQAISLGAALPLAGSSSIAFSGVRLWEGEPGNIQHAVVRISTVQAINEARIKELLDTIAAPRPAIAGVTMDSPRLMGVVNVTPDSFSDGGDYFQASAAIEHAKALAASGADFIDIGAESTRPGSLPVTAGEELGRLRPVLQGLAGLGVPVCVDTRKPEVMREGARAGAAMLNDISALTFAPDSLSTAAELKLPLVLMHAQGEPRTMQDNPAYGDVVIEVYDFLESRIEAAAAAGVPFNGIVADPGIGFGKTLAHNISLLQSISIFHGLGVPLLVGTSRKGFIQKLTGVKDPKRSAAGSVAAALDAAAQGVQILRVHDIEPACQALSFWKSARAGLNIATEHS